jgi:hypothetical protein
MRDGDDEKVVFLYDVHEAVGKARKWFARTSGSMIGAIYGYSSMFRVADFTSVRKRLPNPGALPS